MKEKCCGEKYKENILGEILYERYINKLRGLKKRRRKIYERKINKNSR